MDTPFDIRFINDEIEEKLDELTKEYNKVKEDVEKYEYVGDNYYYHQGLLEGLYMAISEFEELLS